MSTVPKLIYAKIGNKSKNKIDNSSQQSATPQTDDLFSHMNQDNLNYIKKQLKIKKNKSTHQRAKSTYQESNNLQGQIQEEKMSHREKIYHKYKGEEQVSEKEPQYEETERISSDQQQYDIKIQSLNDQSQDGQVSLKDKIEANERNFISVSQNKAQISSKHRSENEDNKMYHSSPYEDHQKRISSIQGYFGEAMSTNLNNLRQQGSHFIEFLQQYITDLHQSKSISKQIQQPALDHRKSSQKTDSRFKKQKSKHSQPKQSLLNEKYQEDIRKLQKLKNESNHSYDGNKYTINSNITHNPLSFAPHNTQLELKKQKLNCIILAQEIQKLNLALNAKQQVIISQFISLKDQNVIHLKRNQQIMLKNQQTIKLDDLNNQIQQKNYLAHSYKSSARSNLQNRQITRGMHSRDRASHQSFQNNNFGSNSHRIKFDNVNDPKEHLFHQFKNSKKQDYKSNTPKKIKQSSTQKWERQYQLFMQKQTSKLHSTNKYRNKKPYLRHQQLI